MRIAQQQTAADAYQAHRGQSAAQRNRILGFIKQRGGDWSIGELAQALTLQKSTVSARVNELLNDTKELVEKTRRKDRISGITIRPVGLPVDGQQELFQ
jgi:DNA-binding MarR family transcriptional regulator